MRKSRPYYRCDPRRARTFSPGDYLLAHSENEMVSIADYYDAAYFYSILMEKMSIKK